MKGRFIKLITLGLTAALCALVCAACSRGGGGRPFDCLVTFDYNLGTAIEADCENRFLGVMKGERALPPGENADFKGGVVPGHYIEGWYLPRLDGEGNPVVGEDGVVAVGEKWDFASDVVSSDITLYAHVVPNPRLTVVVDGGENVEFSYEPGTELREPSSRNRPVLDGHTFYGYYEDAECTLPFAFPYVFGAEDKTIYAKFIEGEWDIVLTADEFVAGLAKENAHLYIDADLDFAAAEGGYNLSRAEMGFTTRGAAVIEGNGHKLKNVSFSFQYKRGSSGYAVFASISAETTIRNIVIEDASVSFRMSSALPGTPYISLFADEIGAGATLSHVTVTGTLTIGTLVDGEGNPRPYFADPICAHGKDGVTIEECDFTGITVADPNADAE